MTKKSTITVNGGAMPKFNRKAIMARAWDIFRETYLYPRIKFSSIGRACFGWALRTAWAEAKEAARIASTPATVKTDRVAALIRAIEIEHFNDHWPSAAANIASMRAEIQQLSAGRR